MPPTQPSVPRDTRLLLAIVLISVALLWVLARIRFPERPSTPNPVPPVLAQLAPSSAFDDIVAAVSRLQPRLAAALAPLGGATAFRFRDDLAIAVLPADAAPADRPRTEADAIEIARDRASGLAVFRLAGSPVEPVPTWSPRRVDAPRFLMIATVAQGEAVVRPVFVGAFRETRSPIWAGTIWTLPPPSDVAPGTFAFTAEGAFVGLAVTEGGQRALVPAAAVMAAAERLLAEGARPPGSIGVDVQPLTPYLAAAAGSAGGVLVAWVDPQGPAAGQLRPTDVVEQIDGEPIATIESWRALVGRLAAGGSIGMRVRRGGDLLDVRLTAAPAHAPEPKRPLGLTLRSVAGDGAAIVRVEADSAAARAGLRADDLLTAVGDVAAPTAAQAARAFAAVAAGRPILVAVAREGRHFVVAMERTW
jgi:hypothetical protein